MTIKFQLKYLNADSTSDINERLVKFIEPGVVYGGEILPIISQLRVQVTPWKIFSDKGMIVEETSDFVQLDVSPGQINVILLKAIYHQNSNPEVELMVMERGIYDSLPNPKDYVVFGQVDVPLSATEIIDSYIDTTVRQEINPLSRDNYRGTIVSESALPTRNNRIGDMYGVCDGVGGPLNLFGWNGSSWTALTNIIALSVDLTRHRQNLFINEKHLTDSEKQAVVGTDGIPSGTNKFVTNSDPRIPTTGEKEALSGNYGSPSSSNKYITEANEFAQPTYININISVPTDVLEISPSQGPVYLGRGGVDSHLELFELFDLLLEREYLNSNSTYPVLTGVYKDPALTQLISDPGSENLSVINANGFYIQPSPLYLKFSINIDSSLRLVFGRRSTLGTYNKDMLMSLKPKEAQIHRDLILKFEEITGRKFDDITPLDEVSTAVTAELKDIKKFINSNLTTDFVVTDFKKMNSVPEYSGTFVENIDIESFKYKNDPILGYTYNMSTGLITFSGSPNLSQVGASHVFIDSNNVEYKIISVGSNTLSIQPNIKNFGSTPTNYRHGSCKVNNNPRQINFSDFKVRQFRDRISFTRVTEIPSESFINGNTVSLAYSIVDPVLTNTEPENRVRLYGNIKQRNLENTLSGPNSGPKTQVYSSNYLIVSVTDFFTDLEFVGFIPNDYLSSISVEVDGIPYTPPTLLNSNLGSTYEDNRLVNYPLVSNLTDDLHTVIIKFDNELSSSDITIGAIDLIRRNYQNSFIPTGKGFVQGDLISKNTKEFLAMTPIQPMSRGGVNNIYYNRNLLLTSDFVQMTELDGATSAPSGSAASGSATILITSGMPKLQYYSVGDIVKVVTSTQEETKIIQNIASNIVTFTNNLVINGSANLIHICSTSSPSIDKEREYRRLFAENTGIATINEFAQIPSIVVDRISSSEDGVTRITANDIMLTASLEGHNYGFNFQSSSSFLRVNACCSSFSLLISNEANQNITYTINNSPSVTKTLSKKGYQKLDILSNGRFQTYEIEINNSMGLTIVGFVFYEPTSDKKQGLNLSQTNYLARYMATNPDINGKIMGKNYPIGSISFDAYQSFVRFVDGIGTPWLSDIDMTKLYGRYNRTNSTNAYLEFEFYGNAFEFEYTATSDSGYALVSLNGVIANSTNYPAVYRGINNLTGFVDMYNSTSERRRVSISNLPYNKYTVKVSVPSPFSKNPASSDYYININQIFFLNSNGYFGYANQVSKSSDFRFGYSNTYDMRTFDSSASFDDLVGTVGKVYGLSVASPDVSTIDGGSFV